MTGKSHQKTISVPFRSITLSHVLEVILLLGVGMLAITLHARWRYPLNLPGHHGIEFMALLMMGRSLSRYRFAGAISSVGIGLLLLFPAFGFKDPLMGFYYMLPGLALDLFHNASAPRRLAWLKIALTAGLAYMLIPAGRLLITLFTGFPYAVFIKHGYILPVLSFFLFGTGGGAIGAGLASVIRKKD